MRHLVVKNSKCLLRSSRVVSNKGFGYLGFHVMFLLKLYVERSFRSLVTRVCLDQWLVEWGFSVVTGAVGYEQHCFGALT